MTSKKYPWNYKGLIDKHKFLRLIFFGIKLSLKVQYISMLYCIHLWSLKSSVYNKACLQRLFACATSCSKEINRVKPTPCKKVSYIPVFNALFCLERRNKQTQWGLKREIEIERENNVRICTECWSAWRWYKKKKKR